MTVTNSEDSWFTSTDDDFIGISGMWIRNDRNNYSDCAWLDNEYWKGIMVGNNGYQNLNGSRTNYYIAGDRKYDFIANDIEIFGVQL